MNSNKNFKSSFHLVLPFSIPYNRKKNATSVEVSTKYKLLADMTTYEDILVYTTEIEKHLPGAKWDHNQTLP